jgi:DNA polymerase
VTRDPAATAAALDMLYGPPLDIISWSLRGMLKAAPGNELLCADFANIEGRGLAWLAGEEWKLDAFRAFDAGVGPDLYLVAAAKIYGRPIDECKPYRQTGKVSELSLGYQGGLGAFRQMEKNLGARLGLTDDQVQTAKQGWRDGHPRIVSYWHDLEEAALYAVLNPGAKASAGAAGRRVTFLVNGSFLWCRLPSGRCLCYPYPKVKPKETPWGAVKDAVHYMTVDGTTNKWVETSSYGGKYSENVTQAICRDILVHVMFECEAAGYPIILHVHDEVVAEVPAGTGRLEEFEAICSQGPKWSEGLPIVAKGWVGQRYRKG